MPYRVSGQGLLRSDRAAAAGAIVVAIAVQVWIPERLVLGPALLMPVVEAGLLGLLVLGRLWVEDPHHRGLRAVSLVLVGSMVLTTVAATFLLVVMVVTGQQGISPPDLVRAGAGIWVTNVVAFALVFWELDLGGPAARTTPGRGARSAGFPDFLFPQYDASRAPADWQPAFADYLYTSFTNATAFSPTDTMPTGHRAKALMAMQSSVAMITMAFLFARAVNIIG